LRYQIQGPLAFSRWHLATALWGMRNVGLSCFAAGENCCLMTSLSKIRICWWHKYCSRTNSAILPMILLDLPSVVFPSQQGGMDRWCKLYCLFDSVYFSDTYLLFYISLVISSLSLFCM
jgi:hypothetical protein